jgi:hypothetical protein
VPPDRLRSSIVGNLCALGRLTAREWSRDGFLSRSKEPLWDKALTMIDMERQCKDR